MHDERAQTGDYSATRDVRSGNDTSGAWTLPSPLSERLAAVVRELAHLDARLATAESCTGGLLAAAMTEVEDASHIVECAFITYSDHSKSLLLGIDAALIRRQGAVSREVTQGMAEAALTRSRATLAIAITVNRRSIGTPYRRAKGTPLAG